MKRTQFIISVICILLLTFPSAASGNMKNTNTSISKDKDDKKDDKKKSMGYKPPAQTCKTLPASLVVNSAPPSVQCQLVSGEGIGIPAILEAGPINAVDVWGAIVLTAEVCFTESGSITFLDALTAPRAQMQLEYSMRDGMTCVDITSPGTVILMPAIMTEDTDDREIDPRLMTADPMDSLIKLDECQVIARYNLNFRDEPAGKIIGIVAGASAKTALARTANWFMVEHRDEMGWITAHYIISEGDCG